MEVTLDRYGRIVIPKEVRERLGLEAGSALVLDVASLGTAPGEEVGSSHEAEAGGGAGEAITLRPVGQRPALERSGRLLVHTGRLTDPSFDVAEHLRRERSARAARHAGLK